MLLLQVEQSPSRETFDVVGRDRKITIWSNRPLLRNRGLKKVAPRWHYSGTVNNAFAMEKLIDLVSKKLDEIDGFTQNRK